MKRYQMLVASAVAVGVVCMLLVPGSPSIDVCRDQSIDVDGTQRRFCLVVPHDLGPSFPVVFAFHGTGDTPESMARYTELNELAAERRFLLVYPMADGSVWNTHAQTDGTPNIDQAFFDQLLKQLTSDYNIDSRRVFAVGMSNGGTFSLLLATSRSTQLAAVVAHSASPPHGGLRSQNSCPTLLIVGDQDPAFTPISAFAEDRRLPCVYVEGLAHEWSAAHNDKIWRFLSSQTLPPR
ncbi:MAG: alpha/beta hydrolase-fold protein [Planctomycetaceae bacterium]|nr:alpha/beta hydrolase-fold protein [Planctomycetaceae bacterium]